MALVFDGPVTPDALTAFVRQVPSPSTFSLASVLPNRLLSTNHVDLASITRTNRTARFRAFDGRIHVSERDVTGGKQVNLPPLSSSIGVGELERLRLQFAQTGGTNTAALVQAIYNDAENLTNEVLARVELARGDVLTDGKFTLAGEGGLFMEADFGVPAAHLVTAATVWSDPAADIIANLTDWVNVYIATNGQAPGGMIVSQRVLSAMLRNPAIRTLAASLAGAPGIVSRPALDGSLDAFGLPPISLVYNTKVDVDGVSTSVIPDDRVIFIPQNPTDLGYTAFGISATALELVTSNRAELSFSQAAGIVGVVVKDGPPFRETTFVDAVGMPVLANANLLFVADVL